MTAATMADKIGSTVAVREKGFAWFATVLDVREVWNRTDLKVTPVSGIGWLWVAADRTDPMPA